MNFTKLSRVVLLGVGLIIGMQSCKTVALSDLEGKWSLKSLNGVEAGTAFEGKTPFVNFDVAKSSMNGHSGCNNFTGGFNYEKGKLTAPQLASTMMMCTHENKEAEFLAVFKNPSKLSIDGLGNLILKQNGKEAMVLQKTSDIDESSLEGTWTLDRIVGGEVESLFVNKLPTIEFKEGRASGNGGCNRYSGQYELDGNVIKIGTLVSTRMACDSLEGETMFLKMLEGNSKIVFDGDKLLFIKDDIVSLVFKK